MNLSSYEAAGVHVERGDAFVEALKKISRRPGHDKMLKGAGGYAAVYPMTPDRLIALTTDGVGTKVLLAHQLGQHFNIGIDLVAMCANDLICVGARPTLFLDYLATGHLDLEAGTQLIAGIVEGCDQAGMILVGGETAEMPDVYDASQYDLAGFALGELAASELITGERLWPGQKIIGVASSGIHSNGLSLARKLLTSEKDAQILLTPTLIYVKPVLNIFKKFPGAVTGICHITGGGWRNLFRLSPHVGYEIREPLPALPVFEKLLACGVSVVECYKTFNMGMGLALMVDRDTEAIVEHLKNGGFDAKIVGEVMDAPGKMIVPSQNLTLSAG